MAEEDLEVPSASGPDTTDKLIAASVHLGGVIWFLSYLWILPLAFIWGQSRYVSLNSREAIIYWLLVNILLHVLSWMGLWSWGLTVIWLLAGGWAICSALAAYWDMERVYPKWLLELAKRWQEKEPLFFMKIIPAHPV